ncbi:MAG: hypothetical protein ACRDYU_10705 [Actinomycetes bacterium]
MSVLATGTAYVSSSTTETASQKVFIFTADVVAVATLASFRPNRITGRVSTGAHAWVSAYLDAAGEHFSTETMSIAEAARVRIDGCRRVTFTVAVSDGWASMVGTIFPKESGKFVLTPIFSLPTRVVYDASTGQIRHTMSATVLEGAERDDDATLDQAALQEARQLVGYPEPDLAVLRAEGTLPVGRGFRVDVPTRELVAEPERDLPARPWLPPPADG